MEVSEYITNYLQRKCSFKENTDIGALNYVENGYVDSLGIIQFVAEIEEKYNISFTDEELYSPSFQIVGDLISLIEDKISGAKSSR